MTNPVDPQKVTEAFEEIGFDTIPPRSGFRLFIRAASPLATVIIDFDERPGREAIEEILTMSVDDATQDDFWTAFDAL
ncbi:MAG: hypothetical protein IH870_06390 [Chloroflexi bacterium]|nr:hypothetical protein [Chloroflexota bacterium]